MSIMKFQATVANTSTPLIPSTFQPSDWGVADTGDGGSLTLSITSMVAENNSTITDVEYQLGGGSWVTTGLTTTGSFVITGLTDDQQYSVKIRAVNGIGNGLASAAKLQTPTTASSVAATITIGRSFLGVAPEGISFKITDMSGWTTSGPGAATYDARKTEVYAIWDFGDSGSTFSAPVNVETWQSDANSANGHLAAHTYSSPGTYTVSCFLYEPVSGKSMTVTSADIVITVPDTIFPTTQTLYVSSAANYTDAPFGAAQYTSLATALTDARNSASVTRVMIKRGETHTLSSTFTPKAATPNIYLCADGGSGDKPIVNVADSINYAFNISALGAHDFTIENINFTGPWNSVTESGNLVWCFFNQNTSGCHYHHATNCEFSGWRIAIYCANNASLTSTFVSDCFITNWQNYGLFFGVNDQIYVYGNRIQQHVDALAGGPKDNAHNNHGPLRWASVDYAYVGSNDLFSRDGWFVNGASNWQTQQPCIRANQTPITGAEMNISRNSCEGGFQMIAATHEDSDEALNPVAACLIERNICIGSHQSQQLIKASFGGTTIRANLCIRANAETYGSPYILSVMVDITNETPTADNTAAALNVYSNTFINLQSAANSGVEATESATTGTAFTNLTVENNIMHQPNISAPDITDTPLDTTVLFTPRELGYIDDDVVTTLDTGKATPPGTPWDGSPLTGSNAIGGYSSGLVSYYDIEGNVRDTVLLGLTRSAESTGAHEPNLES